MALPCTFAYSYCTMPIMPCPAFCPRPALLLLCPLLICPPALPCPAMSSPALSSTALSSPALPANSPISGRSDRKVLRLIYIYQSQNLTVASARNWRVCRQGRRGQGSRRQGRGRHGRTGQGRGTYQKRTEHKQSRAWAKSRAGHDGHCAI